mgnify:CR=1 FL=1
MNLFCATILTYLQVTEFSEIFLGGVNESTFTFVPGRSYVEVVIYNIIVHFSTSSVLKYIDTAH